jgi:glycosyltransferase involved in cell wall biosynthesis
MTQRFHIVSAQRNMGETALNCLESVNTQNYPRDFFRHIFIDDASTDATPDLVRGWLTDHPDHRVQFIQNTERRGMLANNLVGFRKAEDGDIGIELNGDDWIPDSKVLSFFNRVYSNEDVWMTYNTLRQTDGTVLFQLPPPHTVSISRAYRNAPWMTSHLHTFRMRLYQCLSDDVFVDPATGSFWDLSQDMAVYLPMLELAGDHARHIERITCIYHPHAASDHIQNRAAQLAAEEHIRALPPCQPLTSLDNDHPGNR